MVKSRIFFLGLKRILVAFFLLFSQVYSAQAYSESANPTGLWNIIREKGASNAIIEIHADPKLWNMLVSKTRKGVISWMEVAEALTFTQSASLTEELTEALQNALDRNPKGVLSLNKISIDTLCDGGDIDTNPDLDIKAELRVTRRRIKILERIRVNRVEKNKRDCIKKLRAFEIELLNHVSVK